MARSHQSLAFATLDLSRDLFDNLRTGEIRHSLHFLLLNLLCFAVKLNEARKHAELSLSILGRHLPSQHLLLASSKEALANILEFIANDSQVEFVTSNILNSDHTACRTRLQWSR